jgi:hypothetical protein
MGRANFAQIMLTVPQLAALGEIDGVERIYATFRLNDG